MPKKYSKKRIRSKKKYRKVSQQGGTSLTKRRNSNINFAKLNELFSKPIDKNAFYTGEYFKIITERLTQLLKVIEKDNIYYDLINCLKNINLTPDLLTKFFEQLIKIVKSDSFIQESESLIFLMRRDGFTTPKKKESKKWIHLVINIIYYLNLYLNIYYLI